MTTAYIGLGSNLGDKGENLRQALELLSKKGVTVVKVSKFIETKPFGVLDQPDFINAAAELEFLGSAEELLDMLLATELEMGRKRLRHWGERNIDLDLLFFGDTQQATDRLVLPHPGIPEREFVLMPLAEIAPDFVHPVLKKSMLELLKELRAKA